MAINRQQCPRNSKSRLKHLRSLLRHTPQDDVSSGFIRCGNAPKLSQAGVASYDKAQHKR